ncbi:MAG: UDP-glucose/GDP-mannose dehydrogenase family protein [Candidatus Levybacteria bacterium]|nr:UDP-glucose/GDP-mannose dehydrogenase family protein [Candidatus Levybacteria bacterium]
MTITFVGHGYVGLVTAAVFADLGNKVWVIGHTPSKIENLKKGIIPIYEPGLEELVKRNVDAGRLHFTLDYTQSIPESEVIFIAVGTPPKENGEADLSVVYQVAEEIGKHLGDYSVVITKSTVPVGTNREVASIIEKVKSKNSQFDIASVPEFLREGQAIGDTQNPDRVVIGTDSEKAEELLVRLHEPLSGERVLTTVETAEMIKYAANAFLATKISFANAIAQLSETLKADGPQVLEAIGFDKRIGKAFLYAGVGYGGSCFPKDVKALIAIAKNNNYDFALLREVEAINKTAMTRIVDKANAMLGSLQGKTIAVLGLAFKPDTDDMRDAPSRTIIPKLVDQGASIRAYDPVSMENAKGLMSEVNNLVFCESALEAVEGADLLLLLTEWNEFKEMDLAAVKEKMSNHNILDGRNIFDLQQVKELGFTYQGVGR